jgi:poly-gamma-glutamate synthesis protein (capsule biosynthesis protein)
MMFDRSIRERAMRSGNDSVFGPRLQALLQSEDRVVANLEGPITSQPSRSIGSAFGSAENYNFTFHPSWAQTLATRGIGIVNLGNNHILNRGEAGLAETCGYLDAAGVQYFGDPRDTSHRWLLTELQGIRIALVNDNQFMSGGHEAALADIQQARAGADIVIVYTHWGTEYVPATETQKQLAHAFIDAGADAIIGSHPHVVQEREEYQGKMIYYSLGNFIFDQYFRPETQQGLLVEMTIDPVTRKLQFRDIPIQLKTSGETELYDALKTDAIESR